MGETEITIGYEELNQIEIYCPHCNAAVLIDTEKCTEWGKFDHCPVCGAEIPEKLKAALGSYGRFFQVLRESKSKIRFRIKAV